VAVVVDQLFRGVRELDLTAVLEGEEATIVVRAEVATHHRFLQAKEITEATVMVLPAEIPD
jgi:hypothetical protein